MNHIAHQVNGRPRHDEERTTPETHVAHDR
jgi:hypothetical protein